MHPTHNTCPTRSSCTRRQLRLERPAGTSRTKTPVAYALRLLLRHSNRVENPLLLDDVLGALFAQTTEGLLHADPVGAALQVEITRYFRGPQREILLLAHFALIDLCWTRRKNAVSAGDDGSPAMALVALTRSPPPPPWRAAAISIRSCRSSADSSARHGVFAALAPPDGGRRNAWGSAAAPLAAAAGDTRLTDVGAPLATPADAVCPAPL